MVETPIKNRIRHFSQYLQMTDRDFQNRADVGDGFMARQSEPVGGAIASILRAFPQLSPDWLLLGRGSMLRDLSLRSATIAHGDTSPSEVNEPTKSYHGVKSPDITLPLRVYEELLHQLKVKDQQLEDAAAQIRTLFEMLNK